MAIAEQDIGYLKHFRLNQLPFALTPNTQFYCNLSSHQSAINVLLIGLHNREGFLKVVGEVGTGKTLLCRTLLQSLQHHYETAYILNPNLNPTDFLKAIALEFKLKFDDHSSRQYLHQIISEHLFASHRANKQAVLLIDEAQTMPVETLEAVRLLTNLETESNKLLQIVLFGQPELDILLSRQDLRQLKQRITFSHYLEVIPSEELHTYIHHRMQQAGNDYHDLFTKKARKHLYQASAGVPRIINILCHKALLAAYGKQKSYVDHKMMQRAIADSQDVTLSVKKSYALKISIGIVAVALCAVIALIIQHSHFARLV